MRMFSKTKNYNSILLLAVLLAFFGCNSDITVSIAPTGQAANSSSTYEDQTAPPNPTGLTATRNVSSLTLSWTSGGGTTEDYRISYNLSGTAPVDCQSGTLINESNITGTSYTLSSLTKGQEVSFRVCALNGNSTPLVSTGITISSSTFVAAVVKEDCTGYSATNCYTSLASWQANFGGIDFAGNSCAAGDLVCLGQIATAHIQGTWTSEDDNIVTISGWVTDNSSYVKILASGSAKHSGLRTGNHYRLIPASNGHAFTISQDYTLIDGVTVSDTKSQSDEAFRVNGNQVTIKNVLVHDLTQLDSDGIFAGMNAITFHVSNSFFINTARAAINIQSRQNVTINVDHVTAYNTNQNESTNHYCSIGFDVAISRNNTGSVINVRNSFAKPKTGVPAYRFGEGGVYGAASTNNISTDGTSTDASTLLNRTATSSSTPGAGDWVIFQDLTLGAENLKLKSSVDNDAIDNGVDLSGIITDDFEGQLRSSDYDVGADEI